MKYNLPFIIINIIGIIILLCETGYVIFQKPSKLQKIFLVLSITCLISFVGYTLELCATTQEAAMYGCMVGYVGKPFTLIALLVFLFEYANIRHRKIAIILLTIFFVFLTTMVFTNEYHFLYYTSVSFNLEHLGSGLTLGHGPFWYVYMISTIFIFLVYSVIIVLEYKRSTTRQAKNMLIFIFLMLFFGIMGLICFITKWTKGYDATLAGTLLGSICVLILITKYHLFDTIALSKDQQLIDLEDGFIVTDARSKVSFYNNVALELYPELSFADTFKFDGKLFFETLNSIDQDEPIFYLNKVYQMKVNEIYSNNQHKILIGRSYIFKDISASYNYQKTLNRDIKNATAKIIEIQKQIIISFANLVEARDGCTGTHVKNVSKYAKYLCMHLAELPEYRNIIDDNYILMVEECAPLHDVGKIKIPDSILSKPGKLTEEEYSIMKTHTLEGGKIIDEVFRGVEEEHYVAMSKDLVMTHHERWDGTGYPFGLKGKAIPLSGRIMCICDVYDALRMKRPYKKAFDKTTAIEIMKSESGTHFDPVLLNIFLENIDEVDK